MARRLSGLARVLNEVEAVVDWARYRVRAKRGQGPFRILPYRGHGDGRVFTIRGRVLEGEPIPPAREEDSAWRNLKHVLRRIESDEVPAARVRARVGELTWEALADDEGYFELRIEASPPPGPDPLWHPVRLELLDPRPVGTQEEAHATGQVLIPAPDAEFGVISDIDDTVVKTDVANLLRMARLVLLTNAHTRLPFEGVAAFYRALQNGPKGKSRNPIFYVSSSPWNFYDLLEEVFEVHNIPAGPLYLKDYGLSKGTLLSTGHREHKLDAIEEILAMHPTLPFVLIGDSGQQDPEIYTEAVHRHPGRVTAIYIRAVSPGERDHAVRVMSEEIREQGVHMALVSETVTAALHAAGHGLIDPACLDEIRGEQAMDEAAPGPLESVVRPD